MRTLVIIDAQNEFGPDGQRDSPHFASALETIRQRVAQARQGQLPIAWVRHHNTPADNAGQTPAFVPGAWGAKYAPGLGPQAGSDREEEFLKDTYGAFTGSSIGAWLNEIGSDEILLVGFFAHMCVSTTAREALMRGLRVAIDPDGVGSYPWTHPLLGDLSADEGRRTALLHLHHMGAEITPFADAR